MELRALRYFVAIAQEGSMTGAAKKLYVSQPALSRQITELESELRVQLLNRKGRRISLTPEGEYLYQRAKSMLDTADEAKAHLADPDHGIEGDVFMGIGESANTKILFEIANEISLQHPRICFNFTTGNSEDLVHRLRNGFFDYVIQYESPTFGYSDLKIVKLNTSNSIELLVRREHPLARQESASMKDLAKGRFVASRQFMESESVKSMLGQCRDRLNIVATYNLPANAVSMVESGLGDFMVIYKDLITPSITSNLVRLDLTDCKPSQEYLVWRKDRHFSRAARLFHTRLLERLDFDARGFES